jgi:hypothetical protein
MLATKNEQYNVFTTELFGMFLWRAIMASILYKGKTVISGGGGGGSIPNSVPSPFVNSDCHFWFERGVKNLANTTIGFTGLAYQSWLGNVQLTNIYFPFTNYLNVNSSGSFLNFGANAAFSLWWYQIPPNASYHALCAKDLISNPNREWNLTYVNDGSAFNKKIVFTVWDSSGNIILTLADNVSSALSVFTHWVVCRNGSTFTLYKNAVAIASGTLSGSYNATSQPVTLANFASRSVQGHGYCSQFIGFNRALTNSEISALYNSGNGLFSI